MTVMSATTNPGPGSRRVLFGAVHRPCDASHLCAGDHSRTFLGGELPCGVRRVSLSKYCSSISQGLPLDGVSSVDQAAITGESIPIEKKVGDMVLAGTINQRGSLDVEVIHTAQNTTLAKLIQLVEEAQSEKARTQRFIEQAEQYYALGVIILTSLAIVVPLFFLNGPFESTFYQAMMLMVAASPCALVISTPAIVLSAIGNAARHGVLFKGGAYVEEAATIKVVAFEKTGTLTIGQPRVVAVKVCDHDWDGDEEELLTLAASIEAKSEHLLAQAVVTSAKSRGLTLRDVSEFVSNTGMGVEAVVDGHTIAVGNRRYFAQWETDGMNAAYEVSQELQKKGKRPSLWLS